MKQKKILLFFSLFYPLWGFCQNDEVSMNGYSLSSPETFAFEKQQIKGVNYYTGKANINVPIFEIKSGNLTYPLTLSYDTSGIKVDQKASEVGLGWSFNKTIVTRTINGFNDFNNVGSFGLIPNHNYYNTEEVTLNQKLYTAKKNKIGFFLQKQLNTSMDEQNRFIDFLPDTYHLYSNEINSSFFFENEQSPIELNPEKLIINAYKDTKKFPTQSFISDFSSTDFYKIEITTSSGIKYIFNDYDVSVQYNSNYLSYGAIFPYYINPDPPQISTWHISEIIDLHTGKKIKFYYDYTDSNSFKSSSTFDSSFYDAEVSLDYFKTLNYSPNNGTDCKDYFLDADFYEEGQYIKVNKTARVDVHKAILKRIEYDKGKVYFEYNKNTNIIPNSFIREDVYNGKFLSSVLIKDNNNVLIDKYDLNYSYFYSPTANYFNLHPVPTKNRYQRLKLDNIKSIHSPKYEFAYIEENRLPPINSYSIDFLGYFNNSPDIENLNQLIAQKPIPKLYVYPNKFEKTLSPFKIPALDLFSEIPGYFNREANEFSKTWTLKEIKYPTGGFSKFEYESNDFNIEGSTIKGGGIRIKKQILDNGEGLQRELVYTYKKDNISSGNLIHFPYYGHPTRDFNNLRLGYPRPEIEADEEFPGEDWHSINGPTLSNISYWKIYSQNNLRADVLSNAFVDYSNIFEHEQYDKSSKEYVFTSSKNIEFQDKILRGHIRDFAGTTSNWFSIPEMTQNACLNEYVITNSGIGTQYFTSNAYKRGRILEINYFNNNNLLLKQIKNTYEDLKVANKKYVTPITHKWKTNNIINYGILLGVYKNYKVSNFRLIKREVFEYDYQNYKKETEQYQYKGFTSILKSSLLANSQNEQFIKSYYYADDVINATSLPNSSLNTQQLNDYNKLKNINNLRTPIQTDIVKSINGRLHQLINSNRIVYRSWSNNIILPELYLSRKATFGNYNIDYHILRRNLQNGNILEDRKDNITSSYIWGYNNNYIIAKIDNLPYLSLLNSSFNNINENTVESEFENMSNHFQESFIKAWTYKPLIGVSLEIYPDGKKRRYIYDENNRLYSILDNENNIIEQYKYNFKQ